MSVTAGRAENEKGTRQKKEAYLTNQKSVKNKYDEQQQQKTRTVQ